MMYNSRIEDYTKNSEKVKRGSNVIEVVLASFILTALFFAVAKSSLLFLIVAILVWIVHILIKIMISIHLNLVAQLIALDRADRDKK